MTLLGWNQSFLVGLSASSAALILLSYVLPGTALSVLLAVLIVFGLVRGRHLVRDFHGKRWDFRRPLEGPVLARAFLLIALFAVIQFALQDLRWSYAWDGYQIWATKAEVLTHDGALRARLLDPTQTMMERILDYPPMVPMYESLVSRLRGAFELNALKPLFILFFASMSISTYHAARTTTSRTIALAAAVLVTLLPAVSTRFSVGGYADMPQAALVAAAMAAMLERSIRGASAGTASAWLLGGVMCVKSEGTLLALIGFASAVLFVLWRSPWKESGPMLRRFGPDLAIFAGFLAVRKFYQHWMNVFDPTYSPVNPRTLIKAYDVSEEVLRTCAHYLLRISEWGILWPAVGIACIVLFVAGPLRARVLSLALLAGIAVDTAIFCFTNWEVHLHIDQAYDRLLTQIAPVAAVTIAVAYSRLAGVSDIVDAGTPR